MFLEAQTRVAHAFIKMARNPSFERVWNKTLVSVYWIMVGFSYWLKKNDFFFL
jgi:hypothetical protein